MSDTNDLQIQVAEPRGWARRMTITVPAQRVQRARTDALRRVATGVKLPGFRKGKVPTSVVEKRYGAAIDQEMIERLVGDAYREALESSGLQPISQGSIDNLNYNPGTDLTFDVEFEVRPEIRIEKLDGLVVDQPDASVGEEEVDKVVERLREERASWAAVEGGTPKAGDRVSVEITPLKEEAAESRPYTFELGKDQAIPDVEAAIQTLEPGAESEFEIEVPAGEEPDAAVEHQKVRIRLLEIERPELPEADDAFAAEVGPFDGIDALRERIRADLTAEAEAEARRGVTRALFDQVAAANPFEVPDSMLRRYVQSLFRLPEDADPSRVDEILQAARPSAEQAVRRMLVADAIADQHELRASQDEVDARVEEIARDNERPVGEVWSSLQRSGRLESIENEITERKVFEFLKSRATIRGAA